MILYISTTPAKKRKKPKNGKVYNWKFNFKFNSNGVHTRRYLPPHFFFMKFVLIETTYIIFIILAGDMDNNTVMEIGVQNWNSAKCNNKNAHVTKETISEEVNERKKQTNDADYQCATGMKKALANDGDSDVEAKNNPGAVSRKHCKYTVKNI